MCTQIKDEYDPPKCEALDYRLSSIIAISDPDFNNPFTGGGEDWTNIP